MDAISQDEGVPVGVTMSRYRFTSDTEHIDYPPPPLTQRKNFDCAGVSADQTESLKWPQNCDPDERVRHLGIAFRKANEIAEEVHQDYKVPIVWDTDGGRILHTFEQSWPLKTKSYCDNFQRTDDYYNTEYTDFYPERSTLIDRVHDSWGDYAHFGGIPDMWERLKVCGSFSDPLSPSVAAPSPTSAVIPEAHEKVSYVLVEFACSKTSRL